MNDFSRSTRARRLKRAGAAATGALAVFMAIGGFLHTPAGRPYLAKLAGKSCPFGREKLEPARREELRRLGLARLAHLGRSAPSRSSLGFELGRLVRADVEAWAARHRLACSAESRGAGLACQDVPGELVGAGEERGSLSFRFDTRARLVGVLRMVRTDEADRAVALGEAERAELAEHFGAPTRTSGELSVAALVRGPLRQARMEHRYRDVSAFASVTNLGDGGYLVTQEAQLAD
jgi:hypothetical protein